MKESRSDRIERDLAEFIRSVKDLHAAIESKYSCKLLLFQIFEN